MGRQVCVFFEPEHQAGVDAACTGRHDQAVERGEAHRRVDAASFEDGCE